MPEVLDALTILSRFVALEVDFQINEFDDFADVRFGSDLLQHIEEHLLEFFEVLLRDVDADRVGRLLGGKIVFQRRLLLCGERSLIVLDVRNQRAR